MLKKIICVLFCVVLVVFSFTISASAETVQDNYIVNTDNLGSIFGDGDCAVTYTDNTNAVLSLYVRNGNSGFLANPFFQISGSKAIKSFECQPTWKLDTSIFNGSKQYIFDFYIGVVANRTNAYVTLDKFRFFFGDYNNKYYTPTEYIALNSSQGLAHFEFVVDGQILNKSFDICRFEFLDVNSSYLYFGLIKNIEERMEYSNFIIKEYTEADQILDKEEEKGNSTGNSAIDGLTEALPNETDGFLPSIQDFVSSLSYNGTTAQWSIPEVYIPRIPNVIDRTVLLEDLEIDFNYWINKIPSGILTFVQALSTMGLIVYCVKELYSLISYALTLKGGANNE